MTEKLKIIIDVDGKKATNTINGVTKSLKGTAKGADKASSSLSNLFAGVASFAALFAALTATASKLIDVARSFDVINASLVTVTGSTAKAAAAFDSIQKFAATTPFDLKQVANAFIKMKALGLDPSEEALRSYGNTASAMGKSLNQMVEAVADAVTGEFERLKEFGIKARQQGDRVSLTFQGVTTNIGNNAASIEAFLKSIGENEFAGAMERRADSLDGAISNLEDSWDQMFLTISQSGIGDAMESGVRLAEKYIKSLTEGFEGLGILIDATFGDPEKIHAVNIALAEQEEKLVSMRKRFKVSSEEEFALGTWLFGKHPSEFLLNDIIEIEKEIEKLNKIKSDLTAAPEGSGDGAGGGGGDDSGGDADPVVNKEAIRAKKILDIHVKKFERIAEMADLATLDDEERAIAEFDKKLEALDAEKEFLLSKDAWNLEREQAYINARNDIIEKGEAEVAKTRQVAQTASVKFALAVQAGEIKGILGGLSQMTAGLAQHNRAAFEANKAFALAKAGVNIVLGLSEALKLPFPLNIAQGAYVAATGAGQIASIQSASFGGGGSIPTSQGGSAGGVPSQQVQPSPNSNGQTSLGSTQDVNITLTSGIYDAAAVRDLIESINEQTADGVRLNVRLSA